MNKIISKGKEAMDKIKMGIDLVADPVKSTISPMGRTVIINESYVADYGIRNKPLTVTKDGYRISQHISSIDREIQTGVLMIRQACEKQMIDAGDATSTCALLTQAILNRGLKFIEEGANHIEIVKGIKSSVAYIVGELKKMSIPIDGDVEKIKQVATVSANGDDIIGGLIAEAFSKIGNDGIINIEESESVNTTIKISDGIKFHKGWASQYFVPKNNTKQECELFKPYILIYDRPITILKDLLPILQLVLDDNADKAVKRPLMIFCDAVDGEALATLTYNTGTNVLQSCVVEMAFLGDKKRDFMEDIASATGGFFINELKGTKLENITLSHLGQAEKIVVGQEETVIIGGLKDKNTFDNLVKSLKDEYEQEDIEEEKELIKRRIARLKGLVAILSIGGTTEVEMKEKKDRADDAVRATRSAVEEGVVPAGGTAFLRCGAFKLIDKSINDFDKGYGIISEIMASSLLQICENSGVDGGIILDEVLKNEGHFGYNAKSGKVEDLVKAGIIEPTKSNRCALQNAASVVCTILSSKYIITDTL